MCGIFGYVGKGRKLSSLLAGLLRLEYRGYDSCGIAAISQKKLFLKKRQGKIQQLKQESERDLDKKVTLGLLHTRWATHGKPNKVNGHPHLDCHRKIAVVHNGIIENFLQLKRKLKSEGHQFLSETDTEVIVHLIEKFYRGSLLGALQRTIRKLKGSFALGAASVDEPDKLVVARKASPLIIGLGKNENFLASDVPAIIPFTRQAIYLKDEEMAVLEKQRISVFNFKGRRLKPVTDRIKVKLEDAEKKGYKHFMLKEIFEQPQVLKKIFSSYCKGKTIHFPGVNFSESFLKRINKVYITGCGTAYHAGYVAKYFLEKISQLSVEIDTSSEFRYRNLSMNKKSLLITISQSGETADTLAAVREAKAKGASVLSICNVLGSTLVKESDSVIPTLAGPEIGVASTKAYTAQISCLYLFSLYLTKVRGEIGLDELAELLKSLHKVPICQKAILDSAVKIRRIANKFSKFGSFLFLGRGINYPSALEGALKLKEISYIPAEGYPAGEMKHGPIALIDEYRGIICIIPQDELYEKMVSNMQEAKARKGKILAILNNGDKEASTLSDKIIYIPKIKSQDLSPLLVSVCLQLFAYFVAKNLKCEIDQPRNLAKSVTVE